MERDVLEMESEEGAEIESAIPARIAEKAGRAKRRMARITRARRRFVRAMLKATEGVTRLMEAQHGRIARGGKRILSSVDRNLNWGATGQDLRA